MSDGPIRRSRQYHVIIDTSTDCGLAEVSTMEASAATEPGENLVTIREVERTERGEPMGRPLLSDSTWQQAYERTLIFVTALGGILIGFGVLPVSPRGFDGTDLVAWLALAIGVAASAALLKGRTDPVPFLVAIALLVGATAPFVDLALAMALSTILISVLATGSLLIHSRRGFIGFIVLTGMALAVRPTLDLLDLLPVSSASIPIAVSWVVAMVTLVMTAIGFRALREQLMSKDEHQSEINEIIASLAHHIRTPLTASIGFSYLLRSELTEKSTLEYAEGIIRRGWEVSQGLDDLIIIAQSDVRSLEITRRPVDLALAVDACLDRIHGARVKLRYMSVHASVIADPERVIHVLRHLVNNAVLHGGPELTISSRLREGIVELHVSDNGTPLPEDELARVFEAFYRKPASEALLGRGIGLTASRILARAMGGDIRLESGPGGNTAVLALPADPTRSAPIAPAPPERRDIRSNDMRIVGIPAERSRTGKSR